MDFPLIECWSEPPPMHSSYPNPAFLEFFGDNPVSSLLLAYRTIDERYAVVAFDWEDGFSVKIKSPPSTYDELRPFGLQDRAFHLVNYHAGEPQTCIITFPNCSFEIESDGGGGQVLEGGITASSSVAAILKANDRNHWDFSGPSCGQPLS